MVGYHPPASSPILGARVQWKRAIDKQMKEPDVASAAAAKPRSNEPSTMRLVIRAEIIPDESP